jgi:hypothetical protein
MIRVTNKYKELKTAILKKYFCEHGNEPSSSIKKAGYFLTS